MQFLRLRFILSYVLTGFLILLIVLGSNFSVGVILIIVVLVSVVIGLINSSSIIRAYKRFYIFLEKINLGYLKPGSNLRSFNVVEDLTESIERILNGFHSLIEISRMLSREKSLEKLLNLIIEQTTKLMSAERATLFLYNKDTKELWSYIAQDLEIKEIRLPIGKGIAGYVAKTGKIANVSDAQKDSRFDSTFDRITGFKTKNVLCAPMFDHKGEILGVIQVLNKHDGSFNEYDESLISALAAQAGVAIENTRLYEEHEKLFRSFIKTIASVIDARDPATRGHSERVARYSVALGKAMGLKDEEINMLEAAAILHDVGKISIPDEILQKPGVYSQEEYEVVKKHALYTKEILDKIYSSSELKEIPFIAATHHEHLDGSGYPFGLKEKDISIYSRIIAVADIYDALVSYDRPYKSSISKEEALEILRKESEQNKLDKEIVNVFIRNKLYELERREYVRISVELSLEYRILSPEEYKFELLSASKTKDISACGLLFETKESIPVGSFLEVKIYFHDFTFSLIGKVVRKVKVKDKYQTGIKFINLSKEAKEKLNKYLTEFEEMPVNKES